MGFGARKAQRVRFEGGYDAVMVATDGTWRRSCKMRDVSATGARLKVEGTNEDVPGGEFLLFLSTNGRVNRRCEVIRLTGDEIGVRFLKN